MAEINELRALEEDYGQVLELVNRREVRSTVTGDGKASRKRSVDGGGYNEGAEQYPAADTFFNDEEQQQDEAATKTGSVVEASATDELARSHDQCRQVFTAGGDGGIKLFLNASFEDVRSAMAKLMRDTQDSHIFEIRTGDVFISAENDSTLSIFTSASSGTLVADNAAILTEPMLLIVATFNLPKKVDGLELSPKNPGLGLVCVTPPGSTHGLVKVSVLQAKQLVELVGCKPGALRQRISLEYSCCFPVRFKGASEDVILRILGRPICVRRTGLLTTKDAGSYWQQGFNATKAIVYVPGKARKR